MTKGPNLTVEEYTKCLMLNEICGNFLTARQQAELYGYRSLARFERHDVEKSMKDAMQSVQVDPRYGKVRPYSLLFWATVYLWVC